MRAIDFAFMALLVAMRPVYGNDFECVFDSKGLGSLNIGDPESKIRDVFATGYGITERSGGIAQRQVEVRKSLSNEKLYSFSLSNDGRVVLIDVFSACKNADGIGTGSRLGDASKKYGKASLEATDAGYFVVYNTIPTVGFKLENKDLPQKLRNLPDDSISTKTERSILATSNARFSQIRIYPE